MGCMGSSGAAPEEDGGATKEQNRKKSILSRMSFSSNKRKPEKKKEPEIPPDKAKPETEQAKAFRELLLESIEKTNLKSRTWRGELSLKEIDLEDWTDFGYMEECTKAKTLELSYSSFNPTGYPSLHNCVLCTKLCLENCDDIEEETEEKWKFPKLLKELVVTESAFNSWKNTTTCKYLKIIQASACENLPTVLPASLEELDLGATEFSDVSLFKNLKNLKKLDLQGCENIGGPWKCDNLLKTLKELNIDETNFDDEEFLKKLQQNGCIIRCSQELQDKLQN